MYGNAWYGRNVSAQLVDVRRNRAHYQRGLVAPATDKANFNTVGHNKRIANRLPSPTRFVDDRDDDNVQQERKNVKPLNTTDGKLPANELQTIPFSGFKMVMRDADGSPVSALPPPPPPPPIHKNSNLPTAPSLQRVSEAPLVAVSSTSSTTPVQTYDECGVEEKADEKMTNAVILLPQPQPQPPTLAVSTKPKKQQDDDSEMNVVLEQDSQWSPAGTVQWRPSGFPKYTRENLHKWLSRAVSSLTAQYPWNLQRKASEPFGSNTDAMSSVQLHDPERYQPLMQEYERAFQAFWELAQWDRKMQSEECDDFYGRYVINLCKIYRSSGIRLYNRALYHLSQCESEEVAMLIDLLCAHMMARQDALSCAESLVVTIRSCLGMRKCIPAFVSDILKKSMAIVASSLDQHEMWRSEYARLSFGDFSQLDYDPDLTVICARRNDFDKWLYLVTCLAVKAPDDIYSV